MKKKIFLIVFYALALWLMYVFSEYKLYIMTGIIVSIFISISFDMKLNEIATKLNSLTVEFEILQDRCNFLLEEKKSLGERVSELEHMHYIPSLFDKEHGYNPGDKHPIQDKVQDTMHDVDRLGNALDSWLPLLRRLEEKDDNEK